MGKLKRMDQIRNILRTYRETGSIKGTSRRLGVSKNTVRAYVRRLERSGHSMDKVLEWDDKRLAGLCYKGDDKAVALREQFFNAQVDYWIKELRRVGVTRKLLWQEYQADQEDVYQYTQFCERLQRAIGRRDLTIKLHHNPGEKMQFDFAGKTMKWVDIRTGEVHNCQILIATLPHTQHTFAIALPSQKIADFIHGINESLLYFGRLPKVMLCDNLKSFVTRSDKYDPDFNQACVQLAQHYQIDLQATRVRKPKDKASVENAVSILYNRIYAPLRNNTYHSLEELNQAIREQLDTHNQLPYSNKQGSRYSEYMEYEYPVMRELPPDLFELKKTTQSKVRKDYHVYIGEDKSYYSVPFEYVGKQATLIYTSAVVEVYIDHMRVATHARLPHRNAYQYSTEAKHMPQSHREWKRSRGLNAAYFIKKAEQIGPDTQWAIEYILRSAIHTPQSFSRCHAVLRLAEHYTNERLEKSCTRCKKISKATYKMIKNILKRKLDQEPPVVDLFNPPKHTNIRGPQAYR